MRVRKHKRSRLPLKRGHPSIIQCVLVTVVCTFAISNERFVSSANSGPASHQRPQAEAHPKGVQVKRSAVSEHKTRVNTSTKTSQVVLPRNVTMETETEDTLSVGGGNESELVMDKFHLNLFDSLNFSSGGREISTLSFLSASNMSPFVGSDLNVTEKNLWQREGNESTKGIVERIKNVSPQMHQSGVVPKRAESSLEIVEQDTFPVGKKLADAEDATIDSKHDSASILGAQSQATQASIDDPHQNSTVYEKDVYKKMIEIVSSHTMPHMTFRYACPSDCWSSHGMLSKCSCRPSCVGLGTCCFDYFETCAKRHGRPEELERRFGWLREMEKTCINGRVQVSSCRVDAIHQQKEAKEEQRSLDEFSNYFQEDGIDNADSSKQILDVTTSSTLFESWPRQRTRSLTVKGLLKSLARDLQENRQNFDFVEQILISNPIIDMKTNITYTNVSILLCNGGDIDDSKLWNIVFDTENLPIDLATLASPYSLYLQLMKQKVYAIDALLYYHHPPRDPIAPDYCSHNAGDSCPENYSDHTVAFYCSHIYLPVLIEKNKTHQTIYKNAFCFLCKEGEINLASLKTYVEGGQFYYLSFEIDFEVTTPLISVRPTGAGSAQNNTPLWYKLLCSLERIIDLPSIKSSWNASKDNETEQTMENAVMIHRQQQDWHDLPSVAAAKNSETQVRKNVLLSSNTSNGGLQAWDQHEPASNLDEPKGIIPVCRIAQASKPCRYGARLQGDTCVLNLTVIINLPLPTRTVTREELEGYVFSLSRFFEKLIPTAQFSKQTINQFQEVQSGRLFSFKLYLQYEIKVFFERFTEEQNEKTASFLQTLEYPFMAHHRHICIYPTLYPFAPYTSFHLCKDYTTIRVPKSLPNGAGSCADTGHGWDVILCAMLYTAVASGFTNFSKQHSSFHI